MSFTLTRIVYSVSTDRGFGDYGLADGEYDSAYHAWVAVANDYRCHSDLQDLTLEAEVAAQQDAAAMSLLGRPGTYLTALGETITVSICEG